MSAHFQSPSQSVVESAPVRVLVHGSYYERRIKRGFEVSLILLTAPLTLALVFLMAVATVLGGQSPFYCQHRIGRGGVVFRIWKIRTMVADAEARLQSHILADPAAQKEWTATQKLRRDPRVTWLGRILRKLSLDEIPQFWNVIRGDMSLIGPRPMLPDQRVLYHGMAYYRLRPGITGLWQVSERNACSFRKRARLDAVYATRVTFLGDLGILLRTVMIVARGTGC